MQGSRLVVYKKYTNLYDYVYDITYKYPKYERFALVQEIKKCLFIGVREINNAVDVGNNNQRLVHLHNLLNELTLLKFYMRTSYRHKYISLQNYNTFSKDVTDVINMVGGMIRGCPKL